MECTVNLDSRVKIHKNVHENYRAINQVFFQQTKFVLLSVDCGLIALVRASHKKYICEI